MLLEYSRAFRNSWILRTWWTVHFILASLEFQTEIYVVSISLTTQTYPKPSYFQSILYPQLKFFQPVRGANFYVALFNFPFAGAMAVIGLFFNRVNDAYEKLLTTSNDDDAVHVQYDHKVCILLYCLKLFSTK